jgi:hypothetical protein
MATLRSCPLDWAALETSFVNGLPMLIKESAATVLPGLDLVFVTQGDTRPSLDNRDESFRLHRVLLARPITRQTEKPRTPRCPARRAAAQ